MQTKNLLLEHCQTYPQLQIRDIFKFLHQSALGCEHFMTDLGKAIAYIDYEATQCQFHSEPLTEPLDGNFCRVHLDWINAGLSTKTLGKLFFLSAKPAENGIPMLEKKLTIFTEMVHNGLLPFSPAEAEKEIFAWKAAGYPPCHHSDSFRNKYFPAYRVIRKDFAFFLPLLLQIDHMLQTGKVTLAIEGGSASGKTTLSEMLKKIYDATVFHMDDFFLRPEQRTKERLAQPGGNIDWERFLEEVLTPLKNNAPINYSAFDCSTFTLSPPVVMNPSPVTIIEGAYSMHPELAAHYNLSVFLDISPSLQEKRIRKRNSAPLAERFFHEWIPMEQQYFEKTHAKERCDLIMDI